MPLLLVLSTFPSADSARAAAAALVGESLAACVNLLPGVESIYRWEGKIEHSAEVLAVIKTTAAAWPDMERRLRELHPYDVPEILALNPAQVSPDYLRWVCASVAPPVVYSSSRSNSDEPGPSGAIQQSLGQPTEER